MIYVTGDLHGDYDIRKLTRDNWPQGTELCEDDYVIICGDFGFVWSWSKSDKYWLDWLQERPWTTLWVDGNHENHDLIDSFEVEELFGGRVQRVPGWSKVIHLMRGEVYDIPASSSETVRCFTFGGAASHDKAYRVEGKSWWAREMPSAEEFARGWANLEKADFSVDYVFTHECPSGVYDRFFKRSRSRGGHELRLYLQEVDDKLDKERLKQWYFGHYHSDFSCGGEKHSLLYWSILPLGETPKE